MASKQPAATPAKPLAMMTKLSPWVFYYKPPTAKKQRKTAASSTTTTTTTTTTATTSETVPAAAAAAAAAAPKLILLASWMDAQDAHIAKYITHYQALYPASAILLVRFTSRLAWSAEAARLRAVQAAAAHVRSQVDAGALSAAPRAPEVLAHAFSNGGAASLRGLYVVYRRKAGRPFPPHAAVYDSCPGRSSLVRACRAFTAGLRGAARRRLLLAPLVVAAAALLSLLHGPLAFLFGEGPLRDAQRVHNDRALVRQTNRAYVYSREDEMVDWRHVEEHAREAAAKGIPVRTEMFEGTAHVAHMRHDSDRYWKIVAETWEESIRRSGSLLPGFA